MNRRYLVFVSGGLLLAGVGLVGNAVWIHAKAVVAQHLLERAWQRTLAGEHEVRPWGWADMWPVARLSVPDTSTDLIVLSGATGNALAFAPGYLPGSSAPGTPGNAVISGHRDTHFSFLRQLEERDQLLLQTASGSIHTYQVVAIEVIDARRSRLRFEADEPMLTLVTCYPFDAVNPNGPLRYLVTARWSSHG